MRASDVECPTCESDPGRHCKGMKLPEVHMARSIKASNEQARSENR